MSTGFKEALEREISDLEKSLEADPRYIKLRELQRVASLYTPGVQFADAVKMFIGSFASTASVAMPRGFANGAEAPPPPLDGQRRMQALTRQKVLEDAERILKGRTEPTKTADLFNDLVAAGHEIGGDDPKNNLSAMLSKSPLFRSHKRAGWTLEEVQTTPLSDDVADADAERDDSSEREVNVNDLLE